MQYRALTRLALSIAAVLLPFLLVSEGVAQEPPSPTAHEVRGAEVSEGSSAVQLRREAGGAPGERFWAEGQVFGGFDYVFDERFSEFELGRAELTFGWSPVTASGMEITAEAIRSVGPQAVLGVDGNSLLLRIKRAWAWGGGCVGPVDVQGRAGLIPDPWVESLEQGYDFRAARPLLAERGDFFDASDLGAGLRLRTLGDTLTLHLAFLNGEGRSDIERNSGKNFSGVLSWTPIVLSTREGPGVLGLHVVGREGSVGSGSARAHRLGAAFTFVHPRMNAGAELVRAIGYGGRASREAQGLGVWAGGMPLDPWVGVLARADVLNVDLGRPDTRQLQVTTGLYSDVARVARERGQGRVRLHALVQINRAQDDASPIPGVAEAIEDTRLLLLFEGRGRQGFTY